MRHSGSDSQVLAVLQTNIFDISSQEVLGVLYTLSDTNYLLNGLLAAKDPLSVKTAILSKNGIILQATDSSLDLVSIHKTVSKEQFCDVFLRDDICPLISYYAPFKSRSSSLWREFRFILHWEHRNVGIYPLST